MSLVCPYCGSDAHLGDSAKVYGGTSYGPAYICSQYPKCDAYVGVHRGTDKPLGRLANRELRYFKKLAHAAFDPLWKERLMKRRDAYAWLAGALDIPGEECHIGMFDVLLCKEVVDLAQEKYSQLIQEN